MKNNLFFLLTISAAAALNILSPATAEAQWIFKKRTETKKSRKQLLFDNKKMSSELDSLKALIVEYEARIRHDDSVRSEIIDIFEDNEARIGGGLSPEDYNQETTDSLLNVLWHLHRKTKASREGEGYDMDSVRFSSNVSDQVFIERLEKMNSFITLPYNETVRNYMILYSEKMPKKMSQLLGLAEYYFPIFEETLNKYEIPEELKYMAVIESALNPLAVSRAGAKGMWQFMYNTAKIYGLKINSFVDERLDPFKSADAAARYMKDAYAIFGDWSLAISAYNCGFGNVNKAIRRSGKRDFWSIYEYLPRETRGYVPAFVGAMYTFKYYKEYGLVPSSVQMPEYIDTLEINKLLHFKQIVNVAGVPEEIIKQLNPQYMHEIIPGNEGKCTLRLPYKYTGVFIEKEDSIYAYKTEEFFNPTELQKIRDNVSDSQRIVYKVKSGDYLGRIASRHNVTVSQIKKWNHLKNNNLSIGQKLVIYRNGKSSPEPVKEKASTEKKKGGKQEASHSKSNKISSDTPYTSYTVKSGDTLYEIAKLYPGVSAQDIMDFNGIGSKIKPGMTIRIPQK